MTQDAAGPGRARLTADDRRRQLVGIGLRLLITTPIHELSIDEVAAEAGISRSLLFHYFPSKRDYYAAVVRAGARRVLRSVETATAAVPPPQALEALVGGMIDFITRRREPYLAFVRGAAGGDAWLAEIFEELRADLAARTVAALTGGDPARAALPDRTAPAAVVEQVRGWLAYAEEIILERTRNGPPADADQLARMLVQALEALVRLAPEARIP